jgi:hypothetical protein
MCTIATPKKFGGSGKQLLPFLENVPCTAHATNAKFYYFRICFYLSRREIFIQGK